MLIPLSISFQIIMLFNFVDYTAATVGDYVFPPHLEAVGWFLTMTSVIAIVVYAVIHLVRLDGTFIEVNSLKGC